VKQREGEISQLQSDIGELERTRESLTNEMLNLSAQNEKHEAKIRQLSKIQHHYKVLNMVEFRLIQGVIWASVEVCVLGKMMSIL